MTLPPVRGQDHNSENCSMSLRSVSSLWSVVLTHPLATTGLPLLFGALGVLYVDADEADRAPAAVCWLVCVVYDLRQATPHMYTNSFPNKHRQSLGAQTPIGFGDQWRFGLRERASANRLRVIPNMTDSMNNKA